MKKLVKRWAAFLLTVVLLCGCVPAQAGYGTLYMVVDCYSAPMYAGFSGDRALLRYVNAGEIVYCIAALDSCYCVAYENSLGYIDEQYLAGVDDRYYDFNLPNGNYSGSTGDDYNYADPTYFAYSAVTAKAVEKLATRSGPSTDYTDTLTYPQSTQITAYYSTPGSSTDWVYIGFTYRGEKYLLYTGIKRVNCNSLPYDQAEETFSAYINQDITPFYGPGYEYARAKHTVPAGSYVTGVYRTYSGWLMFDYQIPGGKIQRAWAPEGYWR